MRNETKSTTKITVEDARRARGGLRVQSNLRAGPNRRAHDHIGNFNFKVEIEGVTQG